MSYATCFCTLPKVLLTDFLSYRDDGEKAAEKRPRDDEDAGEGAAGESGMSGETKKAKDERRFTPVVFLGHLPLNGVADSVLTDLAKPWSNVLTMVTMQGKGQAFLQLKDADATRAMVQHYDESPATIEGHGSIYVNPAHHESLSGGRQPGEAVVVNVGTLSKILLIKVENARYPITVQVMHTVL